MIPRIDPSTRLLALAGAQEQILSRAQCNELGLGRHSLARLVDQGHWHRVLPGIYSLSPGEPTWLARCWIGLLLGGDKARLGGEAAAHLHGLLAEPPDTVTVLIPATSRREDRPGWQFLREPPAFRLAARGAPARITLEDVVLDLCEAADESEVVDLLTRAVQTRQTTAAALVERLGARSRCTHRRLISRILADVDDGAESVLELDYLRTVEQPHGLPPGTRQAPRGPFLRDVLYEEFALLTELDGRTGHEGTGAFRDMARDNRALLAGEATLRFGWRDVAGDPCGVARIVAVALRQRGWTGDLNRCDRCRSVPDAEFWI